MEQLATGKAPLWTRDFLLTSLSNLFLFSSFQMLLPTLPVHIERLGGDELAVGMVISLITISALLTRPFGGKALDTIGRRPVLLTGLILFILCVIGYALVATIVAILAVRFLHGIGWGLATTAYGTLASDLIPPTRRGEGMGYFGLSANLGMALSPMLGIWLMNAYHFTVVFLVAATLAVLALLLSILVKYPAQMTPPPPAVKPSFWNGLYEKSALFPSLLSLFFAVTYGGIVTYITLYGTEAGIENVGVFFLGNAGMMMALRPFAGVLFDRRGHAFVMIPGTVMLIIGLVLISYADSTISLLIAALFYGAGFGTIHPSLQAWTITRAAPERRGAATGTYFSAFDLGIALGAVLLGQVADATTYATMYRLSTVLIVLLLLIYIPYLLRERAKKPTE